MLRKVGAKSLRTPALQDQVWAPLLYIIYVLLYARLSQTLRFLQVPPSDQHSLLWLANWHSALWLAEHHKPRRKCNAPFLIASFSFQNIIKTVNNVLVLPSVQPERGNSHMTDTLMMLLCVCNKPWLRLISDTLYHCGLSLLSLSPLSLSHKLRLR